jgi:hypothetical protein
MLAKAFRKPWYWWPVLIPLTPLIIIVILVVTISEGIALFSSCVLVAWTAGVPIIIALGVEETVKEHFSSAPDRHKGRFMPAASAIRTVALAFAAYFGLLSFTGGLSYDCSTTEQKSFDSFLG